MGQTVHRRYGRKLTYKTKYNTQGFGCLIHSRQSKKHALPKAQLPPTQCVRRGKRPVLKAKHRRRNVWNANQRRKGIVPRAAEVQARKAVGRDNAGKVEGREIVKDGAAHMVAAKADGASEAIAVTTGVVAIVAASKGRRKSTSKN
jgi:hypothetical protein